MADRAPVPTMAIVLGVLKGSALLLFFSRTAEAPPMVRMRLEHG